MRIILTGATGYAGSEVLRQALADPEVDGVTVLGRRPVGLAHPRLRDVVLPSFLDYSKLGDALEADACIWCLGVSQTAVKREQYIEITVDYTLAAGRALWARNPSLRFCFLSGRAADREEKARSLYGKFKGRAERELSKLNANVFCFRPAVIKPSRADERRPIGVTLFSPITWVADRFTDGFSVETAALARFLIDVAKHGAEQRVFENRDIRNWHPGD